MLFFQCWKHTACSIYLSPNILSCSEVSGLQLFKNLSSLTDWSGNCLSLQGLFFGSFRHFSSSDLKSSLTIRISNSCSLSYTIHLPLISFKTGTNSLRHHFVVWIFFTAKIINDYIRSGQFDTVVSNFSFLCLYTPFSTEWKWHFQGFIFLIFFSTTAQLPPSLLSPLGYSP